MSPGILQQAASSDPRRGVVKTEYLVTSIQIIFPEVICKLRTFKRIHNNLFTKQFITHIRQTLVERLVVTLIASIFVWYLVPGGGEYTLGWDGNDVALQRNPTPPRRKQNKNKESTASIIIREQRSIYSNGRAKRFSQLEFDNRPLRRVFNGNMYICFGMWLWLWLEEDAKYLLGTGLTENVEC